MTARVVTLADLTPHGWVCEVCGHPFRAGGVAVGEWTGMVGDVPVGSNWRHPECWASASATHERADEQP